MPYFKKYMRRKNSCFRLQIRDISSSRKIFIVGKNFFCWCLARLGSKVRRFYAIKEFAAQSNWLARSNRKAIIRNEMNRMEKKLRESLTEQNRFRKGKDCFCEINPFILWWFCQMPFIYETT
jgi:hypothetical protein